MINVSSDSILIVFLLFTKLSKLVHNTTVKLFADYELKRRAQEEKDAEQR